MKKVDIVLNQAIEEDFFALCKKYDIPRFYSRYNNVCGEGNQVPKFGSSIWPQLNTNIVIVCDEEELEQLKNVIYDLREEFPEEGVFCSVSDAEII